MRRAAPQRLLSQSRFTNLIEPCPTSGVQLRCLASLSRASCATGRADNPRSTSNSKASNFISSTSSSNNKIFPPGSRTYARPASPNLNQTDRQGKSMLELTQSMRAFVKGNQKFREGESKKPALNIDNIFSDGSSAPDTTERVIKPHHFHVYSHRHNTHITVTDPERNPIMSVSCGNIGFRHAGRKHYDSAFQLASYVLGRMQENGINAKITGLEVILRGFGQGREAVTKALLGSEGRWLRAKILRVRDATRLKFGGTRSPRPRRLG